MRHYFFVLHAGSVTVEQSERLLNPEPKVDAPGLHRFFYTFHISPGCLNILSGHICPLYICWISRYIHGGTVAIQESTGMRDYNWLCRYPRGGSYIAKRYQKLIFVSCTQLVLSDAIVVWRLLVLLQHKRHLIILPSLLLLGTFGKQTLFLLSMKLLF